MSYFPYMRPEDWTRVEDLFKAPKNPRGLDRLPWPVKVELVILWAIVVFKVTFFLCS